MPQTVNVYSTKNIIIPSDVYSMQITMWGAGGGGESVDKLTGISTNGGDGGSTSLMNLIASGGNGGKNKVGGLGGSYFDSGDWSTTYGVTVGGSEGNSGTVYSGGTGLNSIGFGGDGSPPEASFNASMTHTFDNDTDETTFIDTSEGISVSIYNQTARDGLPCGTESDLKGYGINFNVPYDNASYTVTMNSFCQQAAGGSPIGPFSYAGTSDVTVNGFNVYFCRIGKNSYIACFDLTVTGQRSAFKGAGGGSGGKLTTSAISRETLISAGYNPGQSYAAIVGTKGAAGGDRSSSGTDGSISITYIIQANIKLYANGELEETAIVIGESANLTWITSGDATTTTLDDEPVPNDGGPLKVTPSVSTTYTAFTTGLGGSDIDTVLVRVYQKPTLEITLPNEINYGEKVTIEYEFEYVDVSATITPQYKYRNANNDGFDIITGDPVEVTPISTSAEFGVDGTLVGGSIELEVPYNDEGPFEITYKMTVNGSGGSEEKTDFVEVIIDLTPDNIIIPATVGNPEEEPIYSPDPDKFPDIALEVLDIDIPVEIKSDKPIKVSLDNGNTWLNVREKL